MTRDKFGASSPPAGVLRAGAVAQDRASAFHPPGGATRQRRSFGRVVVRHGGRDPRRFGGRRLDLLPSRVAELLPGAAHRLRLRQNGAGGRTDGHRGRSDRHRAAGAQSERENVERKRSTSVRSAVFEFVSSTRWAVV